MFRTVRDVMHRGVVTCKISATTDEIAKIMLDNDVSALVVIDEHLNACGVVTKMDLIKCYGKDLTSITAEDIITSRLLTVSPDTRVYDAVQQMLTHKVHQLVIVTEGGVLGDDIWMWVVPPEKAPDKPEEILLRFVGGIPIELNGKEMLLDELIDELNVVAGRNGIGRIDMFEDGIISLKSREIYEAPAAQVILKLHRDLEQQCLTKEEIQYKKGVDARWAYMVYHGEWYHPLKDALDAFVASTQHVVNGVYRVSFYKGNIRIAERGSKTSLFTPEIRSIKARGFDQRWCANAAKVRGLPFEILAKRRRAISGQ